MKRGILCWWVCMWLCASNVAAQLPPVSSFFIENSLHGSTLNPARQPWANYLSVPLMGEVMVYGGTNSIKLSGLGYSRNGQLVNVLGSVAAVDKFYKSLPANTLLQSGAMVNIIGGGMRISKRDYVHFAINQRGYFSLQLPKELLGLALYGTGASNAKQFDLSATQSSACIYTEFALGWSKELTDKWMVGITGKLLLGEDYSSVNSTGLVLDVEGKQCSFSGQSVLRTVAPVTYGSNEATVSSLLADWLSPRGWGGGLDAGVIYRPDRRWKLSLALLDAGWIMWYKQSRSTNYQFRYTFSRSTIDQLASNIRGNSLSSGKLTQLSDSMNASWSGARSEETDSAHHFSSFTSSRIVLGAQYQLADAWNIGCVSQLSVSHSAEASELTVGVAYQPYQWLNAATSYSLRYGNLSSVGLALGLKTGPLHWLLAADYLPFHTQAVPVNSQTTLTIPYSNQFLNLHAGINLLLSDFLHSPGVRGLHARSANSSCHCEY